MLKKIAVMVLLVVLVFTPALVSATAVDVARLYDLEGLPGDTINIEIKLKGTQASERVGYWDTIYTNFSGDEESKMNITSWITIEPKNYTLKQNETKEFTITITIPKNAEPGLYGVNSTDAKIPGHWYQRRTWIQFKDTDASTSLSAGGVAVYTGFKIPVSVKVLGKPNPLAPIIKGIKANITVIILLAVILILLVVLLRRKGGKEQGKG